MELIEIELNDSILKSFSVIKFNKNYLESQIAIYIITWKEVVLVDSFNVEKDEAPRIKVLQFISCNL